MKKKGKKTRFSLVSLSAMMGMVGGFVTGFMAGLLASCVLKGMLSEVVADAFSSIVWRSQRNYRQRYWRCYRRFFHKSHRKYYHLTFFHPLSSSPKHPKKKGRVKILPFFLYFKEKQRKRGFINPFIFHKQHLYPGLFPYSPNLLSAKQALVPPKPNEFERAIFTVISLAVFGT